MSLKITRQVPAIGEVEITVETNAELVESLSFFGAVPDKCDICGTIPAPWFKKVTTKRDDAKVKQGTVVKYYGLRCANGHEYYFGTHNDDSREIFAYADRKFQEPYSDQQLQSAEPRDICPHCKSTNQFH